MTRKNAKVLIAGKLMSAKKYAEARACNKGASAYIKARREASRRAKQIDEMNGPCSMEWVQSALFLYAVKKNGLEKDLKKAIWAYTSALIEKLEDFVTNADRISKLDNPVESYHWIALQLRSAIHNHIKILDMFKGDVIQVPQATPEGKKIRGITHNPMPTDASDAMTYLLQGFRQMYPDSNAVMPKKDD